jgi:pyrroline-5-carboxylate reductase
VNSPKIAFIGGGNMGRALIGGLLERGATPDTIRVGEAYEPSRAALLRDFGVVAAAENSEATAGADVVVVAVKPQDAGKALIALQPSFRQRPPLIISVAAGIRTQDLETWCGLDVPVVRSMPNRPALVGVGATGLFAPERVGEGHRTMAEDIMRAVGAVVWVHTEDALDVVTALSGSGPAYFFLLAELMMQAAIDLGLEPAAARTLAIETLHGAGALAHASDGDLARLRAEVTSKGGTTEAAVRTFEGADLRAIVARALTAATQRGRELAAQFGAERKR